MSDCQGCKDKAELKQEKLMTARKLASDKSKETGETMAIVKLGCNFFVMKTGDAEGLNIVEYISKYA